MRVTWKTPVSLVVSLWRNFWGWVRTRRLLAPPERAAARMKTCHGCLLYDSASGQCTECTCFVAAKVALRAEKCPHGFWK